MARKQEGGTGALRTVLSLSHLFHLSSARPCGTQSVSTPNFQISLNNLNCCSTPTFSLIFEGGGLLLSLLS